MIVDIHVRLKKLNHDLLDLLTAHYRVESKNQALNRLLDDIRNGREVRLTGVGQ